MRDGDRCAHGVFSQYFIEEDILRDAERCVEVAAFAEGRRVGDSEDKAVERDMRHGRI